MTRKKPQRRAAGMGTVKLRADGRFVVSLTTQDEYGQDERVTKYLPKGTTRRQAELYLAQLLQARDAGRLRQSSGQTFADYLPTWLERIKRDKSMNTYRAFSTIVNAHLLPRIGKLALEDLHQTHVQKLLDNLEDTGAGVRTRANVLIALRSALKYAVRMELLDRNVASRDYIDAPRISGESERDPLTPEQAQALLDALEGHPHALALQLAVYRGMRIGEILALSRSALDLDNGRLTIRQNITYHRGVYWLDKPKTPTARRTIYLSEPLIAACRERLTRQHKDRVRMGTEWKLAAQPDILRMQGGFRGDRDLLFTTPQGRPVHAGAIQRLCHMTCERLGLPDITPHDLRHTFNTVMVGLTNVDETARLVSMGHASSGINRRYTHAEADRLAAAQLAVEDEIRKAG